MWEVLRYAEGRYKTNICDKKRMYIHAPPGEKDIAERIQMGV